MFNSERGQNHLVSSESHRNLLQVRSGILDLNGLEGRNVFPLRAGGIIMDDNLLICARSKKATYGVGVVDSGIFHSSSPYLGLSRH
jgi:hypothetical protein